MDECKSKTRKEKDCPKDNESRDKFFNQLGDELNKKFEKKGKKHNKGDYKKVLDNIKKQVEQHHKNGGDQKKDINAALEKVHEEVLKKLEERQEEDLKRKARKYSNMTMDDIKKMNHADLVKLKEDWKKKYGGNDSDDWKKW